jgi:restriction system protein
MPVPDYQSLMLPLLQFAREKKDETSSGEAVEALTKELNLTEADLKEMLPSGIQSSFVNRVGWAATYMKKAGLLEATRRGYYRITARGQDFLKKQPKTINVKLLKQFPEFLEFQQLKGSRSKKVSQLTESPDIAIATPSEALESAC